MINVMLAERFDASSIRIDVLHSTTTNCSIGGMLSYQVDALHRLGAVTLLPLIALTRVNF